MFILKLSLATLLCFIFGCAAIIGGDVAGVEYNQKEHELPFCSKVDKKYQLKISIDHYMRTEHDNQWSIISWASLGVIPSYWVKNADTSYQLYKDEAVVSQKEYDNRFHMMFGIALYPFHFFSETNKVNYKFLSNRFPFHEAIKSRTLIKALADVSSYINKNDICIK